MSEPTTANLTRDETAARSAQVTVHGYRVELDVTGAPDAAATGFPSTVTVEVEGDGDTWLDFLGESVEAVRVDGAAVPVEYDGARVALRNLRGRSTVRVEATGRYSRSGEGLHRFVDPVDGATYLYTQYEPADCRRVFACFEQPDMKAPFTFEVTAPEGWEVISNREAAATEQAGPGAVRVRFAPTLPIPTYITAVVAGPYHRVDGEWRGVGAGPGGADLTVPLGVLCRASLAQHLDADAILEVTRQGLDFFHDAFGYPYPWGKYDQVFVPEYNLGAMENPGCVTFTEKYVFRGEATRAQYEARATTILHEMAHMWFGDLVTMRWWDDLWLKESFADYMGTLACAEATEFTEAWVAFAERRKAWAYRQDQLPTTHPVVADIVDLEAAKLNFDGITYAKGAAVLKQLVAYVGREAFFEGSRRYFRAHAYGNTTLTDLLAELSSASGRDLDAWARAWLQTTGVATLTLEQDGPSGEVVAAQSDGRPHRFGAGRYDYDGDAFVRVERADVELTGTPQHAPVPLAAAPLIVLNDDDLTYAKTRLDARSLGTVESGLSRVADPLARGQIWAALWNAVRDGELDPARYLAVVARHAPGETNTALLASALANADDAVNRYVPEADRARRRGEWLDTAWSAVQSGGGLPWARALAGAASVADGRAAGIRALLDGSAPVPEGLRLDPDLRWSLWTALAATGHAGPADLDSELAADDTAGGRTAHLRALAARPDPAVKRDARRRILEDESLTNDQVDALIAGFRAGRRRDLIAEYDDAYFAGLTGVWRGRSIEIARRIVLGLFPAGETTDAVEGWLAAHPDAPGALRRLVIEQGDHLARAIRVRGIGR
ncbi:aminopeptidase N [Tomitella fengzijianii]|uniref:Aminopeptidase N n=1 Tax=Tomitella fengzijianii TaxID=2597660 RepID=A0A516X6P2_9ACTN|nr:aminopeptidase N [Tomitella fengzijianii]QDQ98683.1 aminopeptidase N [Tomitella fengzijianii]